MTFLDMARADIANNAPKSDVWFARTACSTTTHKTKAGAKEACGTLRHIVDNNNHIVFPGYC